MYGEVHANHVYYKVAPQPGHRFRQIGLHELEQFIVLIGEGDVIHDIPSFQANNPDAEAYFHNNLADALADVDRERRRAEEEGWTRYHWHGPGA